LPTLAQLADNEGRPEAVFDRLAPVLDRAGQQERLVTLPLALLAWANLEVGQEAEAQMLAAQSVMRARVQRYRPVLVDVLRIEALIASRQGCRLAAETAISEALALSRRMRYPYAEAKLLDVYGQLHLQNGESTHAREQFEQALAIYARLGEYLYAKRIISVFDELGEYDRHSEARRSSTPRA
jgi:tetratricopeptide (TPR) repeat protein